MHRSNPNLYRKQNSNRERPNLLPITAATSRAIFPSCGQLWHKLVKVVGIRRVMCYCLASVTLSRGRLFISYNQGFQLPAPIL